MLFIHSSAPALNPAEHDRPQKFEESDQYHNGKFRGPGKAFQPSFTEFAATTWGFLFAKNNRTPDTQLPHTPVELAYFKNTDVKQLNVTWLGHSSLMVNIDGYKITHNIFFSGDSGYFEGFKQIGRKYGPFDMTFLECGAYNTAWHPVHMFPEETVQAHLDLKGALLHPIHWATFNLALHPWYKPMERLTAAAEKAGIKTVTPVVGATTVSGEPLTTSKWWHLAMPKAPA